MNRGIVPQMSLRVVAVPVGAVAGIFASAGCSQQPTTSASNPRNAALQKNLGVDDVAAVRKIVPSEGPAYRAMLRIKNMEKDGTATVKYPDGKGKPSKKR